MIGTRARTGYLEVAALGKRYRELQVLAGLDFQVGEGELVSLLGPSGCGKSTLLRIVAGLTRADEGRVVIAGRNVTDVPAHRRNVSVVFQNYALFPHLSVAGNVAFGLRARGTPRDMIGARVDAALDRVRLREYAARAIGALSGGQQQRVAVARALVVEPKLLLLDEPFSALDRTLRETMQVELKSLLRERGITAVFVTHDQDEALAVSDRVAVMNAGRIEQFGEPSSLYARPESAFVMEFVGLSTRLAATVTGHAAGRSTSTVTSALGELRVPGTFEPGTALTLGVRPELIDLAADESGTGGSSPERNRARVRVADVMCLGSRTLLHGVAGDPDRIVCELPGIDRRLRRDAVVTLAWRVDDTLVFRDGRRGEVRDATPDGTAREPALAGNGVAVRVPNRGPTTATDTADLVR